MIITEAGKHPDVKALVYVAAFQPDIGESVSALAEKMPPANKSIGPVGDGYLAVNPEAFPADFAAGVPKSLADFMAISQVPIFGEALKAKVTVATWKDKPSYAVVDLYPNSTILAVRSRILTVSRAMRKTMG